MAKRPLFVKPATGLCLRVWPEEMSRRTVDDCNDELQLGLAATRREQVAKCLPRGWGRCLSDGDLNAS